MSWNFRQLASPVRQWLGGVLYPIDKTNLDPFVSCISLLWPLSRFAWCPRTGPGLAQVCFGRSSSAVSIRWRSLRSEFCYPFVGHFATLEVSSNVAMQVLVSVGGVTTMVAMADAPSWCNSVEVPVRFASHLSGGRGTAGRELRQMTPIAGDCDGLVAATPPARQESLSAMRNGGSI